MAKIEINKAAEILKKNQIDPAVLRRVIEEFNLEVQPESGEEKPPAVKKQFAIIVSDPDGRMPKHDFVAWAVQIPENESPATTLERIYRAAYDFNASKKGRLLPVRTVGESLENVPARYFSEADVWVKTKTPVLLLRTDNEIPKERPSDGDLKEERAVDAPSRDVIACSVDGSEKTELYRHDGKYVVETTDGEYRCKTTHDTEIEAREVFNERGET